MSKRVDDLWRASEIQRTGFDPGPADGPPDFTAIAVTAIFVIWFIAAMLR
jgi:hypothetical protein